MSGLWGPADFPADAGRDGMMLSHAPGCAWYDAYVETGGGWEH